MSITIRFFCWVLGEDCDRTNLVEIALDKLVGDLKKAIKEEKKPALDHLPADALDLWMVSVPFDENYEQNVNAPDLTARLLPSWRKLASLFSQKSADVCLDIVVKVLDSKFTFPSALQVLSNFS